MKHGSNQKLFNSAEDEHAVLRTMVSKLQFKPWEQWRWYDRCECGHWISDKGQWH